MLIYFPACFPAINACKNAFERTDRCGEKLLLRRTVGWGSNLSVILRVIVGQCSELAYDVVFFWIVTDWNREDYGLERVHLDVLAMNRSNEVFPRNYGEIMG